MSAAEMYPVDPSVVERFKVRRSPRGGAAEAGAAD